MCIKALDLYLKGETTTRENELVENWLAENNNENNEWQKLDEAGKGQWMNNLFNDIEGTLNTSDNNVVPMHSKRTWWRNIAAAAAIVIISSALFLEWPAIHDRFYSELLATLIAGGVL